MWFCSPRKWQQCWFWTLNWWLRNFFFGEVSSSSTTTPCCDHGLNNINHHERLNNGAQDALHLKFQISLFLFSSLFFSINRDDYLQTRQWLPSPSCHIAHDNHEVPSPWLLPQLLPPWGWRIMRMGGQWWLQGLETSWALVCFIFFHFYIYFTYIYFLTSRSFPLSQPLHHQPQCTWKGARTMKPSFRP